MNSKVPAAALLTGMVAVALLPVPARADVVTDWNVTANAVMTAENVGNNPRLRNLAMMHVAMSDAINTVQNRYTRVVATIPLAPSASAEAAAAAAAQQILTELYPAQKAKIEETYTASLKAIPDGSAKSEGVALGMQVAADVQAECAKDGTDAPDTYRPHTTPGAYVSTQPPVFEQYARAKPWVLKSVDQFRPGPPPALTSAEWARDYNEVKSLGGTKSTARTAEQSEAVKFWGNVNFGGSWQAAARELSAKKELDLAELGAPVGVAQHELGQRLHGQLGRQVPLPFLATRHRNPQWRPGRQRRHRARCRLDFVQPESAASRIPVAGDHQRHDCVGSFGVGVRPREGHSVHGD